LVSPSNFDVRLHGEWVLDLRSALQSLRQHRASGLLQLGCALLAHIQIVADQEAAITNQPLTDGTVIQMLDRVPDGTESGTLEFLLVDRVIDNLLALCLWHNACFGKTHRLVGILRPADTAGNAEEEHIPGGQVLHQLFNEFFQSQFTAFLSWMPIFYI